MKKPMLMKAAGTVFIALTLLAMPWFLGSCQNRTEQAQTELAMDPENRMEIILEVEGMTCTGCEGLIQRRVAEIPGVESVKADHLSHEAVIVYDKSVTDVQALAKTIEEAGYKVVTDMN